LSGEVYVLNGSNSTFRQEADAVLRQRIVAGDVHLSGPLAGKAAGLVTEAEVRELESRCLADAADLIAMLEQADVDAARRSLRVIPTDWRCEQIDAQDWRLEFRLPKGCFATGLVRELARIGSLPRDSLVQK
jgi:tRNA pseudouridine13 synthase